MPLSPLECLRNLSTTAFYAVAMLHLMLWRTIDFLLRCRWGERSTVMSMSDCLSVRSHNSKITRPNFSKFLRVLSVAVALSCSDSVYIDVMYFRFCNEFIFSPNRPTARHLYSYAAIENDKHGSRDSNKFCSTIKSGRRLLIVSCTAGGKSAIFCLMSRVRCTSHSQQTV